MNTIIQFPSNSNIYHPKKKKSVAVVILELEKWKEIKRQNRIIGSCKLQQQWYLILTEEKKKLKRKVGKCGIQKNRKCNGKVVENENMFLCKLYVISVMFVCNMRYMCVLFYSIEC